MNLRTRAARAARVATAAAPVLTVAACLLAATAGSIPSAQAAVGVPQVVQGDEGFPVYCVQDAINWSVDAGLALDGDFGPATYKAVRNFQGIASLKIDGEVGPLTGTDIWAAIQDQISVKGNFGTPYGIPIGNCYRVIPTSS
ncbi:peptidoglycan-binding domain-containing protein [Streptacidiphilus anmyonensis]|uniref:peptidoglycan-binding domain-containing protein n=1 Tax=Streptacidiphilus anmyonensis TaxID=405782 RepID=UPI0006932130|nr:peptidoglycan-binding protein [Streptacidiphilus anmyonensis]